jgi:uncharacterized protein YkwD
MSPDQGKEGHRDSTTVETVTSEAAATPIRLALAALVLASLAALVVAGRADGRASATKAHLAQAGSCVGADDPGASPAVQSRAVACLVNWARAQDGRRALVQRPKLRRASALKGRVVASCKQFSHTPCGAAVTSSVRAAGYRFAAFGENLFAGAWGRVTARQVVAAWLQSPSHRATLLHRSFRHFGAAPVRAPALLGGVDAVVWTATFASPS